MSTEKLFGSFRTAAEKSEDKLQRVKTHKKHLDFVHFSKRQKWTKSLQASKKPKLFYIFKNRFIFSEGDKLGKEKKKKKSFWEHYQDVNLTCWLLPGATRGGCHLHAATWAGPGRCREEEHPSPIPETAVLTLASGQSPFCYSYARIRSEIFLKLLLRGPFSSFFPPSFCRMKIKQSRSYTGFSAFTAS